MENNTNLRKDYGKYSAPDYVKVVTAQQIEVGDVAVSPAGLQSTVIDKKLLLSSKELNQRAGRLYDITFASKTRGVVTKRYTPNSNINILSDKAMTDKNA